MKTPSARALIAELKSLGSDDRAAGLSRFFKTGPGDYSEGDIFLGCTVPETRALAKKYRDLDLAEIEILLHSKLHEVRLAALMILVTRFERAPESERKKLLSFYLSHKSQVNNWDLVDSSAHKILGPYLPTPHGQSTARKLLKSKTLWDRRIAVVATLGQIRKNNLKYTFEFSELCLEDDHDLMHKACGWMLREAGKVDADMLRKFIDTNGHKMPRTMLRYSIERFSPKERKHYLITTLRHK